MYPWLRVMYAVVVMGSRIRRSAWGMNLSTFWPCASATDEPNVTARIRMAISAVRNGDREGRLLIATVSEGERARVNASRPRCDATFYSAFGPASWLSGPDQDLGRARQPP